MKSRIKKLPGGVKFMLIMIMVYLLAFFVNASFALKSAENFLQTFVGLIPILIFVFIVIHIINVFLNPEVIKKHLGYDSGLKGWLFAFLGSVLITSPPYVILPLLGQLRKHGMKYSLLAVFLGNKNVQPVFLPVMAYYFGLRFTIVISVYIMIFTIITGLIIGEVMDSDALDG